jgi:hypothetical protein
MVFVELRLILAFFGHGDEGVLPLRRLLLCLRVVPVDPSLVTGDDPRHEGWIIRRTLMEILAHCDAMFFLLRGQQLGDKLGSDTPRVQFRR